MGLDMYLWRTAKVNGFTPYHYDELSDKVVDIPKEDYEKTDLTRYSDNSQVNDIQLVEHGLPEFHYTSVFEEVGYWRKANQIHKWFIDNVQGGEDECNPYFITSDDLDALLRTVLMAKQSDNPENYLPTHGGFFFGTYEYDDFYYKDLDDTIEIIQRVLRTTDFDKQVLIYHSSW